MQPSRPRDRCTEDYFNVNGDTISLANAGNGGDKDGRQSDMRKKLTLQINTEELKILVIEPYGYVRQVAKGDVIEMTYVPEDVGDTVEISDKYISVWCFEPLITINGIFVIGL